MKYGICRLALMLLCIATITGTALAVPNEAGNFFIGGTGNLTEYDVLGNIVTPYPASASIYGVAINPLTNNLAATAPGLSGIYIANTSTGTATLHTTAGLWDNIGSLHALAFSPVNGRLYAVDATNNVVYDYMVEGGSIPVVLMNNNIGSGYLDNPMGIAFVGNTMYVSNQGNNTITVLSSTFAFQHQISNTSLAGGVLADPRGMTVGLDGKLYVVNSGDGTVLKIDPITQAVLAVYGADHQLDNPNNIALTHYGTMLVTDATGVVEYDLVTGFYTQTFNIAGASGVATIVPEPATLLLLGIGLGGLAWGKNRKKK